MYIAYGSVEDNIHHGSTKLHIDMTDAVNIMVWASDRTQQQQRYALWRIFPQAASHLICQFLWDHAGFSGPGHPIHSQGVYFTEDMLSELEARTGIRPFTIKQYTGEAIYIPAGCAHQVRYLAPYSIDTGLLKHGLSGQQSDGRHQDRVRLHIDRQRRGNPTSMR